MLTVHDNSARASTQNIAAMDLAMLLCPRAANVSGPVGSPEITDEAHAQAFRPRFAA